MHQQLLRRKCYQVAVLMVAMLLLVRVRILRPTPAPLNHLWLALFIGPCESLHVGNMSLIGMSRRTTAALRQAVPTIAEQPGALARPAIRRFEFEALVRLDPAITGQAPPGLPPTSQHEPRRRPRLRVVS